MPSCFVSAVLSCPVLSSWRQPSHLSFVAVVACALCLSFDLRFCRTFVAYCEMLLYKRSCETDEWLSFAAATATLASVAQLRAASSVVDEPVADLGHANTCRVGKYCFLLFTWVRIRNILIKPCLHYFGRLLGQITSLARLSMLIFVMTGHKKCSSLTRVRCLPECTLYS